MQITEITENYRVYVDLDGVLCDLQRFLVDHFGQGFTDNDDQDQDIWDQFRERQDQGLPTFSALSKMPDADELWNWLQPLRPHILTATGSNHQVSAQEKTLWVKENLSGYGDIITVPRSAHKAKYACGHCVLIDDRSKSIDPWRQQGGIGIHHVNAQNTIDQLKNLGIKPHTHG